VALQERDEITPLEHQQLGLGQGHRIGGAIGAIEQGDLADHLARVDQVQHQLLAILGVAADLHPATHHDHHVGARIALAKQHRTRRMADQPHVRDQPVQLLRLQPAEQRHAGQQRTLIDGHVGWHSGRSQTTLVTA
jgi:hypothetical protein